MGNWTEHGNSWYSCNRYEEKESTDARDAQSKSRASLERYLHVCFDVAYYVFAGADYFSFGLVPPFQILVSHICAICHIATSHHTLKIVLQSLGEPRAVSTPVTRLVRQDGEEDGGNASDVEPDVDRSPVCSQGCG